MKLLLDFLPILVFFATFKWGEGHRDQASHWMTQYFGAWVDGGVVGLIEGPMLLATVAVAAVSVLQIVGLKAARQKIDTMLWVSLAIVLGLGALTLYFHSETFIKWKPTAIYWAMASGIAFSDLVMKRYVLRTLMKADDMGVPEAVWRRISWSWVVFLLGMGFLNLYVAFHYSSSVWVDFKLWGGTGLMLLFTVIQGLYLGRHMPAVAATPSDQGTDQP